MKRTTMQRSRRWTATIMVPLLLLMVAPTSYAANAVVEADVDLTLSGVVSQDVIDANGHVRLTENFKDSLYQAEYENTDGTYTTYFFSTPVKYVNDDGKVEYIDTSLKNTGVVDRLKGYSHKTTANAIDVYFPASSNGKILLEGEDFSFTQQLLNTGNTVKNGCSIVSNTMQFTAMDTAVPVVAYQPTTTGYMSTITFNSAEDIQPVTLLVVSEDITALSLAENIVSIIVEDETKATIYVDALKDATDGFTQMPVTDVRKTEKGYTLTFTFSNIPKDAEYPLSFSYYSSVTASLWERTMVQSENPTRGVSITTATMTGSAIQDTVVSEAHPNTNYANEMVLTLDGGVGATYRIYTKFDLSSLVAAGIRYDRILSARYSIYQNFNYPALTQYEVGDYFDITLHQVSENYTTSTVTWNTKPDNYEKMLCGASIVWMNSEISNDTSYCRYYDFMLTSLVQGWMQGIPNYGIVIRMADEAEAAVGYRRFASSYFTTSANAPLFAVTYTADTTSCDNIGIESGAQYYIKCKGSVVEGSTSSEGLYLTAPNSTSQYVTQTPFTGATSQKWRIMSAGDGYYYLLPGNYPSAYTLYATGDALYEIKVGNLSDPSYAGYDDYKKWKFVRNWDGSYHIVSKAGNGSLGLWTEQTLSGSVVYHYYPKVRMDHLDDWTLEKVAKGTATLYCFDDNALEYNLNSKACADLYFKSYFSTLGYTLQERVNRTAPEGRQDLNTSDLWIFSGHGGSGCIWYATDSTSTYMTMSAGQITGYPNSSQYGVGDYYQKHDLSNLRFVVLNSCHTGNDYVKEDKNYSLSGILYAYGAHFVLSHTDYSSAPPQDQWLGYFFEASYEGKTIQQAMEYADSCVFSMTYHYHDLSNPMRNLHILGDTAMCLYPTP